MNSRSFSSWNRERFDLEAPPLPLLNGGLLFSFSKSLKGNRVNLFSGEGRGGNFATIRGGGLGRTVGKRPARRRHCIATSIAKFLAPIPLSMRDARELSNPKDFRSVAPLSAGRYVEFQFGSSRLATPSPCSSTSPFLGREIFFESKRETSSPIISILLETIYQDFSGARRKKKKIRHVETSRLFLRQVFFFFL